MASKNTPVAGAAEMIERLREKERARHAERMAAIDRTEARLSTKPIKSIAADLSPRDAALIRLCELSDEYTQVDSAGRFEDSASREWKGLPMGWRMNLLMLSGVGGDLEDLERLATRGWREIPEPERHCVRALVRSTKTNVGRLVALSARA